eukprot:4820624-Pyramimonas_sp.AAC.1
MEAHEADAHRCRGGGLAVRWRRSKATPGRTHAKYQAAELSSITGTLITRYEALRIKETNRAQQQKCARDWSTTYQQLRRMWLDQILGK